MLRKLLLVFMILVCLSSITFVGASVNQIHKGDTVFIGESGLVLQSDVFYGSDTQLAYFSSSSGTSGSPQNVITPTKNSFYVSPSDFSGKTGAWYSYPEGVSQGSAINVNYPSINLKLYAYRGGDSFDITNGKIVSGEALDIRIDSNLYPIFSRTGVSSSDDGIDIIFKTSSGATYSYLYDCSGNSVSIRNIHPTSSDFFVPDGTLVCLWDTSNPAYRDSSYTIYAEVNVNSIKDNLGSITGATITSPLGNLQSASTPQTTVPTATKTPTPTKTKTPAPTKTTVATTIPTTLATQSPTPTASPTISATSVATTAAETATAKSPLTIAVLIAGLGIAGYVARRK